jgi:RNA polymerase sigma factor (sigma-70 family)
VVRRGQRPKRPAAPLSQSSRASQEDEFDRFVLASRVRLIRYVKALTGDSQVAQDITQEAFLRAWRRWSTVRGYDDPQSWCRHVAHNLAVERWRQLGLVAALTHHAAAVVRPAPEVGHLDVAAAIRRLPKGERNAVVMHGVLDMSVREISQELRVSEGTVKSWLSRGRTRLRRSLGIADQEPSNLDEREGT